MFGASSSIGLCATLNPGNNRDHSISHVLFSLSSRLMVSSHLYEGITAFELEYAHWIEEHQKKTSELRNLLQSPTTDMELELLVQNVLNHYSDLFLMKLEVAKADVFYLISGAWRTPVERFYLWIGGFRPSEMIKVCTDHYIHLSSPDIWNQFIGNSC